MVDIGDFIESGDKQFCNIKFYDKRQVDGNLNTTRTSTMLCCASTVRHCFGAIFEILK